ISIRDNQIYNVCNFSRRKYLKSFPTMGYWLSLFPIAPIIGKAVESLCCAVLPTLFGTYKPPQAAANPVPGAPSGFTDQFKATSTRTTINMLQQTSFKSVLTAAMSKSSLAGHSYSDYAQQKTQPPKSPGTDSVALTDLTGQSVNASTAKLKA